MEDIVNGFALFFSSPFSTPPNVDTKISVDFLKQFPRVDQFSVTDSLRTLLDLKPKFTKGPDGIPAFIIRD